MEKVGNKVKDAVKIAVKRRTEDAIEGRVDKIKWTNQGEIIEATRNIVKDVTKKTKHGEIIEATRNMLKDATMMAQDKLKKAGDSANAIKDAVKGGSMWKNRDEIIDTTQNMVKDVTKVAGARGLKGRVEGQIANLWKNRGKIF